MTNSGDALTVDCDVGNPARRARSVVDRSAANDDVMSSWRILDSARRSARCEREDDRNKAIHGPEDTVPMAHPLQRIGGNQ
jgi:hypothetical protein